MRAMRYDVVNPAEYISQIHHLLKANWEETGFDFPFNPDIEAYNALYVRGMVFAVAAFDGDEIVGYCTISVTPHLHNPEIIVAASDALFVDVRHRRSTVAYRILKMAENEAMTRGAVRMAWHCRSGTGFAAVLTRHGYESVDEVVVRGM